MSRTEPQAADSPTTGTALRPTGDAARCRRQSCNGHRHSHGVLGVRGLARRSGAIGPALKLPVEIK